MFIQVVRGKIKDAEEAKASGERWEAEIRPGAIGFLGSTSGVTDDGDYVVVARFESAEAAKANSERPEQGRWFAENSKMFDGSPTFYDCPDVETMSGGGSDEAGFVQVMIYKPKDVQAVKDMAKTFEKYATIRPDLLGATTAFATDGTVIDTNYFTSEADAREGEKKEMPAEIQEMMEGFGENVGEVTFLDLRNPRLT